MASNTSFSKLSASGTTALGGAAFSISLTPGATFTNNSVLQLITSTVSGTITNASYTVGGYNFKADYTTNAGTFDVDITAVPEPSTWVMGGMLVAALGVSRRRQIADWLGCARA